MLELHTVPVIEFSKKYLVVWYLSTVHYQKATQSRCARDFLNCTQGLMSSASFARPAQFPHVS